MSTSLESLMRDTIIDRPGPSVTTELFSFLVVGGTMAACFAALSTVMIDLRTGVADWVMSALCYAVMIAPAYLAHRRFSFRSSAPHAIALPRYVAVQISAICLAAIFSFVCYGVFGMAALPAALVIAALTAGVNFVVLRVWAFAVVR